MGIRSTATAAGELLVQECVDMRRFGTCRLGERKLPFGIGTVWSDY